jgi:hypothetical protein
LFFVALVLSWRRGDANRPLGLDEVVPLLVISLAKNEGLLFACGYVVLRTLFMIPRPEAGWRVHGVRALYALGPGLAWLIVARLATGETHYALFAVPGTPAVLLERLGVVVGYYAALPWAYTMVPLVIAMSAWRGRVLDRWIAAHALGVFGFMLAAYLLFDGNTLQVVDNSFHRLHWPALLLALVAAMRILGDWPDARERAVEA